MENEESYDELLKTGNVRLFDASLEELEEALKRKVSAYALAYMRETTSEDDNTYTCSYNGGVCTALGLTHFMRLYFEHFLKPGEGEEL